MPLLFRFAGAACLGLASLAHAAAQAPRIEDVEADGEQLRISFDQPMLTWRGETDTAGITRYVIDNLSPATYYFAMTAFTSAGAESERSTVLSKSVG